VDWINPHIVLAIEAKGEGSKVEQWTFQSNPPSCTRRRLREPISRRPSSPDHAKP